MKKLLEFNDSGSAAFVLSDAEKDAVTKAFAVLEQENRYHSSQFENTSFLIMEKLALQWHSQHLLPVLDVVRVMALHLHAAEVFLVGGTTKQQNNRRLVEQLASTHLRADAAFANQLMVLRLLANMFRFAVTRQKFQSLLEDQTLNLLSLFEGIAHSTNKNIQTALATVCLNTIVLLCQDKNSEANLSKVSAVLLKMLQVEQNDDALFRVIVGLGTAALQSSSIQKELKTVMTEEKQVQLVNSPGITDKSKSSLEELIKVLATQQLEK